MNIRKYELVDREGDVRVDMAVVRHPVVLSPKFWFETSLLLTSQRC